MKKNIIISTLCLSFSLSCMADMENPDTLLNIDPASKLVITENPAGTFVEVTAENGAKIFMAAAEYKLSASVKTSQSTLKDIVKIPLGGDCNVCNSGSWDLSMDGLCIGLSNAVGQTGGGGLQWSKSFEISWLSCFNIKYSFSRSEISVGLGFDWRNYKSTFDNHWLTTTPNGDVEWGRAPEGCHVKFSRLKVFSLQIPLFYEWKIPKSKLSFKAGPIACFNTYASLKGVYEDELGKKGEFFTKAFSPRRCTVDLFGSLSYGNGIGIYVRYSPMKVLKDTSPINFHPFTLGIGFFI